MQTGIHDNQATQQRELWVKDGGGLRLLHGRPRWQVDAEAAAGQVPPWGSYPDRGADQQPEVE